MSSSVEVTDGAAVVCKFNRFRVTQLKETAIRRQRKLLLRKPERSGSHPNSLVGFFRSAGSESAELVLIYREFPSPHNSTRRERGRGEGEREVEREGGGERGREKGRERKRAVERGRETLRGRERERGRERGGEREREGGEREIARDSERETDRETERARERTN